MEVENKVRFCKQRIKLWCCLLIKNFQFKKFHSNPDFIYISNKNIKWSPYHIWLYQKRIQLLLLGCLLNYFITEKILQPLISILFLKMTKPLKPCIPIRSGKQHQILWKENTTSIISWLLNWLTTLFKKRARSTSYFILIKNKTIDMYVILSGK